MSLNRGRAESARLDDATELLARAGYDKNGRSLAETNDSEGFENETTRYRSYFDRCNDLDEDIDANGKRNAVEIEDIRQAAQRDEARAKVLRAIGAHERAEEAERHAYELRQLVAVTARHVFRTHELFSYAFTHAVQGGHWNVAQAHLIDAIKSTEADYALKVACAKALSEIVTPVPGDKGAAFDGRWLAGLTGIPLRTAQDLIESARALESGLPEGCIVVPTQSGGRHYYFSDPQGTLRRFRTMASRHTHVYRRWRPRPDNASDRLSES